MSLFLHLFAWWAGISASAILLAAIGFCWYCRDQFKRMPENRSHL